MAYPLAPMIRVRELREQAAAAEMAAATARLEQAIATVAQREDELAKYREWRLVEEKRLFEKIKGQAMPISGVDAHNTAVLELRGREIKHEEAVMIAKTEVTAARKTLDHAKAVYYEAVQEKRKITEHREIWQEEARKEAELAENNEMDEFTKRSKPEEA